MTKRRFWSPAGNMKNATRTISTREAILDATDRLLARHGYKKMTIDDLAAEVGIGKGSVYLHFASKEEIAAARLELQAHLTKAGNQTVIFCFEADKIASTLDNN